MSLADSIASFQAEKSKYLSAAKRYFTSLALSYNSKQIGKRGYSHAALLRYCEQIDLIMADPLFTSEPRETVKKHFLYDEEKGKFVLSFVNQFIRFIEREKDNAFVVFPLVK